MPSARSNYVPVFKPHGRALLSYLRNTGQWDIKPLQITEESKEDRNLRLVKQRRMWTNVLDNLGTKS